MSWYVDANQPGLVFTNSPLPGIQFKKQPLSL